VDSDMSRMLNAQQDLSTRARTVIGLYWHNQGILEEIWLSMMS